MLIVGHNSILLAIGWYDYGSDALIKMLIYLLGFFPSFLHFLVLFLSELWFFTVDFWQLIGSSC